MNCKYTYKGVQYNSYWGLREAILNEESQDYRKTTGLLASADTRQSDVREAIELVKLDFNLSQDDGELIVTDFAIPLTFTEGQMSTSVQENLEDRRNSNYKSQLIKF